MKSLYTFIICLLAFGNAVAQTPVNKPSKKGSMYVFWGWNRDAYTHSDIRFKGDHYDFTLYDVEALDRQSPFEIKTHLNPARMTIPQTNVRVGYFLKDNLEISVGVDHMKYVMTDDQYLKIKGYIAETGTPYDSEYDNDYIFVGRNFLLFEHTDGLNYINFEVAKHQHFYTFSNWKYKPIHISGLAGAGIGALLPKSNTMLIGYDRYDEFHLAGYGTAIKFGMNIGYKNFFIQGEWKGGYINMPDIRTTQFKADRAEQHFYFSQANFLFGYNIPLNR